MRMFFTLLTLATPAYAWEFSASPICTLTGPQTTLTYDASLPEYTITITNPDGWQNAPVFAIRYNGARPLTISTDRHRITDTTVAVADSGFGNVLDGMQFSDSFTAMLGDQAVTITLEGIDPAMTLFRACPAPATS